jgi:hypothetical protein
VRHAELADQKDIERRMQGGRDFPADRDATARQPENQKVVSSVIGRQLLGQDLAGFAAVPEGTPRASSCESTPTGHD